LTLDLLSFRQGCHLYWKVCCRLLLPELVYWCCFCCCIHFFSALSRQLLLLPLLAHTSNSLTEVAHYLPLRKVHKVATKNAHRLATFSAQRSPLLIRHVARRRI